MTPFDLTIAGLAAVAGGQENGLAGVGTLITLKEKPRKLTFKK